MKIFGFIFAVLLLIGTAASLQSTERTSEGSPSVTIKWTTNVFADSVDTVTIGPLGYDMGLFGLWVRADTLKTPDIDSIAGGESRNTRLDSTHITWKVLGKGSYWRPMYVDTTSTNGLAPVYASAGTALGVALTHAIEKWAVFYDPSDPRPIPLLAESDYIQIRVSRTCFDSLNTYTRFTFYWRAEKDIP